MKIDFLLDPQLVVEADVVSQVVPGSPSFAEAFQAAETTVRDTHAPRTRSEPIAERVPEPRAERPRHGEDTRSKPAYSDVATRDRDRGTHQDSRGVSERPAGNTRDGSTSDRPSHSASADRPTRGSEPPEPSSRTDANRSDTNRSESSPRGPSDSTQRPESSSSGSSNEAARQAKTDAPRAQSGLRTLVRSDGQASPTSTNSGETPSKNPIRTPDALSTSGSEAAKETGAVRGAATSGRVPATEVVEPRTQAAGEVTRPQAESKQAQVPIATSDDDGAAPAKSASRAESARPQGVSPENSAPTKSATETSSRPSTNVEALIRRESAPKSAFAGSPSVLDDGEKPTLQSRSGSSTPDSSLDDGELHSVRKSRPAERGVPVQRVVADATRTETARPIAGEAPQSQSTVEVARTTREPIATVRLESSVQSETQKPAAESGPKAPEVRPDGRAPEPAFRSRNEASEPTIRDQSAARSRPSVSSEAAPSNERVSQGASDASATNGVSEQVRTATKKASSRGQVREENRPITRAQAARGGVDGAKKVTSAEASTSTNAPAKAAPRAPVPTPTFDAGFSEMPTRASAANKAMRATPGYAPQSPSNELVLRMSTGLETQLAKQARQLLERGEAKLRVRLDPPHLGKLLVKLEISDNQAVARIVATSPEAASLLHREREELARAFADQGFDDVQVEVDQDGSSTFRGRDGEDEEDVNRENVSAPTKQDGSKEARRSSPRHGDGLDWVA